MKDETLVEEVEIPKGVEVKIEGRTVTVKGPKGENSKEFKFPTIKTTLEDGSIKLEAINQKKVQKRNINTMKAHLKNLIKGVLDGFTYTLKICSGHFPMNVSVSGKDFLVKNFLGEKVPRVLKLKEGANVKVEGQEVTVYSVDLETAGQVAADIEQLTRVTNKDIRIFQDGIYIIKKPRKDLV
jgi:large subunit ribosomal protein L6